MERLTKHDLDIGYYMGAELVDEYYTSNVDGHRITHGEVIARLAELENIIEEGELAEVIRCKDCIDWNEKNRFNDTKICEFWSSICGFWSPNRNFFYTEPDEFCICGKRR